MNPTSPSGTPYFDWRGLDSPQQRRRYQTIASLVLGFSGPDARILDVGCGEGVLTDHLPRPLGYTGIELSEEAVASARQKHPNLDIRCISVERFCNAPSVRYDCIVLTEVLYYLADPIAVLRELSRRLEPTGIVVCSIFQKPLRARDLLAALRHRSAWTHPRSCQRKVQRFLASETRVLEDWLVTSDGLTWRLWAFRPKGSR